MEWCCHGESNNYRHKSRKMLRFGKETSPIESALFYATRCANHDLFNHLFSQYQSFSERNKHGDTLLHAACVSCDLTMVQQVQDVIIKKYPEMKKAIDIQNADGDTCLHLACKWGSLETTKFLIEKGGSINIQNNAGETSFHLSIVYKRWDIFSYFLDNCSSSIDINATTSKGETPLHIATSDAELYDFAESILAHSKLIA